MRRQDETAQLRRFGAIVGGLFGVIGVWPALIRGEEPRLWALGLALGLVVPALLWPRSLTRVYRAWMAAGEVLGWINTRVILCVIFYALVTPMGLLMRALGKDPMRRAPAPGADTYRVPKPSRPGVHMARQF